MKLILISIILTMTSFFSIGKNPNSEDKNYNIIKKIENIEIRKYNKLIYASYIPKNESDRNNSFRKVADYIFGNNLNNVKIDMTSPVVIKLHNKHEMAFIMPKKYNFDKLPKPNNKEITIYEESSNIKACIKYSGYSNNKTEQNKINELKKVIEKYNITHNNDFEVLVYNSPWKIINRRNEITVSIKYNLESEKESGITDKEKYSDTRSSRNSWVQNKKVNMHNKFEKKLYLGGGCFWCIEAVFEDVIGVNQVRNGYAGGKKEDPKYVEVSNGLTKHAEVCEINYDSRLIKLESLLEIFFLSHDPTTINKQGNDIGEHYRSIILHQNEIEKKSINDFISRINKEIFDNKIVTEIKQFNKFYKAEQYHQDYYKRNKYASYCSLVITPKVIKAKEKLSKYYKK